MTNRSNGICEINNKMVQNPAETFLEGKSAELKEFIKHYSGNNSKLFDHLATSKHKTIVYLTVKIQFILLQDKRLGLVAYFKYKTFYPQRNSYTFSSLMHIFLSYIKKKVHILIRRH